MLPKHIAVHAAGAETVTGNSAAVAVTSKELAFALHCTAAAGTSPTLDVTIEWSGDGVNFVDAGTPDAFAQLVAAGDEVLEVTAKARYYRVVWTITGSAGQSFTFAVIATHFDI